MARTKVYIIDEVHMLSKQAFNGLLKTLEEPPEHVKFLFATTEIDKVPVTVRSRCLRFDLRRVEAEALVRHLAAICDKEKVEIDHEALLLDRPRLGRLGARRPVPARSGHRPWRRRADRGRKPAPDARPRRPQPASSTCSKR